MTTNSPLIDVSLTITKASLQPDGTMRWQAVASDTNPDRTGERTSLALFKDWIERVDIGKSVSFLPPPRQPFLGISHYPDLDGKGEAGTTDQMYVDGDRFKARGVFYPDRPVGKALFDAVRQEKEFIQRGGEVEQPIRISAAWWDLAHSHGNFIYERKSLSDRCPMCAQGAGDKTYLQGQLDHFASTRVPINPGTSLALEEKAMAKTRKDDAASIIGEELAEELEETAKPLGKSETEAEMVIKADDDEPEVAKMDEEHQGATERPLGGATTMAEAKTYLKGRETAGQVYGSWGLFQTVMGNILRDTKPDEVKARVQAAVGEFNNEIGAIKAAVEDAYLVAPVNPDEDEEDDMSTLNDALAEFGELVETTKANVEAGREQKIEAIQAGLDNLVSVVKADLDAVAPPDPTEATLKAFTSLAEKLDTLVAKLDARAAQPQTPQPPVQKSYVPGQVANGTPAKVSPLTAMIRRSVGIVE